jgi:ribonuclease VapC
LTVIDTSALMAILLGEADAEACIEILETEAEVAISAGTMAEALIVADRRNVGPEMAALIDELGLVVEPVSAADARRVALAYARWGRGAHPAGLNFGDCFAYALAQARDLPLLYVGDDFTGTDVRAARR